MEKTTLRGGTCMALALAVCIPLTARGVWAQNGQTSPSPPAPAADQAPATAATSTGALPAFEVVSIKPHKDEGIGMRSGMRYSPDGFEADGVPLQMFILQAFGLSVDRILNEPDWVRSARFDINAKVASEDAPRLKPLAMEQRFAMMLPVLEDRFGLKYHHETRQLQVYALVVAKGGPKLKESTLPDGGANALPPPPIPPGASGAPGGAGAIGSPGGPRTFVGMSMSTQGAKIDARGESMASLAQLISRQIGGTVVDKTGLTGGYDFTLAFLPDNFMVNGQMIGPPGGGTPDGAQSQQPVGPSIFTAVQEQLGLKLEAKKEPVDVVVIDQIAQPTAN